MGKLDKVQITKALINEMFKIAGYTVTYDDIVNRKDAWYLDWTMTEEQNKRWVEWGTKFIQKHMNTLPKSAQDQMRMFNLNYGLKIEDEKIF